MKTSDILQETNISKIATSISSSDVVNVVAEHLWHHYVQDEDVERFFNAVKIKLAENRKRSQPQR